MTKNTDNPILSLTSVGIDIGKDVFHLVGFDPDGCIVLRRMSKRLALANTTASDICGHFNDPKRRAAFN